LLLKVGPKVETSLAQIPKLETLAYLFNSICFNQKMSDKHPPPPTKKFKQTSQHSFFNTSNNMERRTPLADISNNARQVRMPVVRHRQTSPITSLPPPANIAQPIAPLVGPPAVSSLLYTLPARVRGRKYVARAPYTLFETGEGVKNACLDPAHVIGLDGKATHLSFQIASWQTVHALITDFDLVPS
jgi:hypothetical protein